MKVFSSKLRNLTTSSVLPMPKANFTSFIQRWGKINQQAMIGGGQKRINK
jgi:hypothetical protein